MLKKLLPWIPSFILMAIIFGFSSIPSAEMPSFGLADLLVKKGGHMLGYAMLALAYWFGLRLDRRRGWLAWILAIVYALSDEYHQSFVPGRNPSLIDALAIDQAGASISLILVYLITSKTGKPLIG